MQEQAALTVVDGSESLRAVSGEIIAPNDLGITVVVQPSPFRSDLFVRRFDAGLSLAEILAEVQPNPILRGCSHVRIAGHQVPREIFARVRPKAGTHVHIASVPQLGGGQKNPLRFILMLAVAAASIFLPPLLPGAGALVFGAGSALAWSSVYGAASGAFGKVRLCAFARPGRR